MKRALALSTFLLLGIDMPVHADAYDCFPLCPPAAVPADAQPAKSLCDVGVVREAARVNEDLKPVKEIYEIATNPTGYAVKLVDRHVVHIPKWVGYAMDPRGAIKGEIMKRARDEAKKQVGLQDDCAAPPQEEDTSGGDEVVEATY